MFKNCAIAYAALQSTTSIAQETQAHGMLSVNHQAF